MTYRKLEKDEWHRLKPIFEVEEWPMPSKDLATAAVAEDEEGRICGVLILQVQLHCEPLWIRPKSKGTVTFRGLAGIVADEVLKIKDRLPEGSAVYFITALDNVGKLAEPLGFEPMEERVWRLEVK
jgi:hypothetical protein